MSGAFVPKTRQLIIERDEGRCVRCGRTVDSFYYSIQHRRSRGLGGSKDPVTRSPANAVLMCGSATSPDGCHYFVESQPNVARAEGWRVDQGQDPRLIPVRRFGRFYFLADDGGYTLADDREDSAAALLSEIFTEPSSTAGE